MSGGGNNQLLDTALMVGAAVAAPEIAPALMGGELGLGAGAATAIAGMGTNAVAQELTKGKIDPASLAMAGMGGYAAGQFLPDGSISPDSLSTSTNQLATAPSVSGGMNPYSQALGSSTQTTAQSGADYLNSLTPQNVPSMPSASPASAFDSSSYRDLASAPSNSNGIFSGMSPMGKAETVAGGSALVGGMFQPPPTLSDVPGTQTYSGPLSKFKYDPNRYQPDVVVPPNPLYRAQYAEGGIANLAIGGAPGQMYPQSMMEKTNFAKSTQYPTAAQQVSNYNVPTNPLTGDIQQNMAMGGMPVVTRASGGVADLGYSLGGYSDGGRLLKGPGTGISDDIPATIADRQPARLADGEFVVPARIVSEIGQGSTDAGARKLYEMMHRVQNARNKTMGKDKFARNSGADRYVDEV